MKKRTTTEQKILAVSIVVIVVCMFLIILLLISNRSLDNGTFEDIGNGVTEKTKEIKQKSESTGYDMVTETAIPANMTYSDAVNLNVQYSYMLTNEDELKEEGFTDEQVKVSKVLIEQYIGSNETNYSLENVMAVRESIYSCDSYFGAVFCLNEEKYEYVMVTGDGETIDCEENIYDAPPVQYDSDIAAEEQEHDDYAMLYKREFPMDIEEFPYSETDVSNFVKGYYADLATKNNYENYLTYFLPMRDYMEKEWTSINCQFSTFKRGIEQLKLNIADGDEELAQNGTLSASVEGYRQFNYTMVVAKVKVTLASGKKNKSQTEYVSIGYNDNGMIIVPKDMFTADYWRYLYLY